MFKSHTFRGRRIVGAVALASLVLAACGDDGSGGPEVDTDIEDIAEAESELPADDTIVEDDVTVEDSLVDDTVSDDTTVPLVGEEVTVSGNVTTLTDPTLFSINSPDGDVIVLAADGLPADAGDGTLVQVSGTVREVLVDSFDTDFGFAYDPTLYGEYENQLAIDADEVVVLEGDAEQAGPLAGNAEMTEVNESGVEGDAAVVLDGTDLMVTLSAENLTVGQPHVLHLHVEPGFVSECPTTDELLDFDLDGDSYVSDIEGAEAYGALYLPLTIDSDPATESTIDLAQFPTGDGEGRIEYQRTIELDQEAADFLAGLGSMAVVVHGLDLDESGVYDGEGVSSLDPNLPLEATLPVACGVVDLT